MNVKKFFGTLLPIVWGVAVALALRAFVLSNDTVPTESMEPTIMAGDRVVGSKLSYISEAPARGDVITFIDPEGSGFTFVKRIIGLPGETITIASGKVYINDSEAPLTEEYINPEEEPIGDFGPYIIPENCYFVMGDNRNHSDDSRHWKTTHFVGRRDISSKVLFKYYPKISKIN